MHAYYSCARVASLATSDLKYLRSILQSEDSSSVSLSISVSSSSSKLNYGEMQETFSWQVYVAEVAVQKEVHWYIYQITHTSALHTWTELHPLLPSPPMHAATLSTLTCNKYTHGFHSSSPLQSSLMHTRSHQKSTSFHVVVTATSVTSCMYSQIT